MDLDSGALEVCDSFTLLLGSAVAGVVRDCMYNHVPPFSILSIALTDRWYSTLLFITIQLRPIPVKNVEIKKLVRLMFCPECNTQLLPVVLGHVPNRVHADACLHCGGIWLEKRSTNLNYLDVAHLTCKHPHTQPAANLSFLCPKDRTKLVLETGAFHKQFTCPKCSGMFLPYETVKILKREQLKKNYILPHHSRTSWMPLVLPGISLLILFGTLVATISGLSQKTDFMSRASDMLSEPSAIRRSTGEYIIIFTTREPTISTITVWDAIKKEEMEVSSSPRTLHSVKLTQLETNATYKYQIHLKGQPEFDSSTFTFISQ